MAVPSSDTATKLANVIEEEAPSVNEGKLAKELRRQSMDGSIPVSLKALQVSFQHQATAEDIILQTLAEQQASRMSMRSKLILRGIVQMHCAKFENISNIKPAECFVDWQVSEVLSSGTDQMYVSCL